MRVSKQEDWRQKVGDAVVDIIAREGLGAATVRRIAAEIGYSTAIVSHYFSDKDEVLLSAYRSFAECASTRFDEVAGRDPADLVGYLLSMNLLDPTDLALWRAYVAIWDKALRNEVFATELRSWLELGLARIEIFIKTRNPDCAQPRKIAARLLALIQGISIQMLFGLELWSPQEVRRVMETEVEALLG